MKPLYRFGIAGLIFFTVGLPFLQLVLWSLADRWFYPGLLPQEWGWRAWGYIFDTAGTQIIGAVAQSLAVATVTALVALLAGLPAGRALGLYAFKGKDLISVILILPVIVPPLCVSMGLHLWFIRLGLAESFWGVVLVHLTVCLPYTVFVLWGVFSIYNPDFEDQARTLGATTTEIVFKVMLPLTLPGLVVAALFSFLLSWSQYLATLIIGGGRITTLPIILFALMSSGDRPVAAAVSIVFVAPAFLALLFSARYLGRRIMVGIR
ncbi:MAG: ABC transporter permease subunit [Desulfobacterales bacterium]